MSLSSIFYLADVADSIKFVFILCSATAFTACIFSVFGYIDADADDEDEKDEAVKYFRISLIALGVLLVPAILIPSSKTIYLMTGAQYADEANLTPELQKIRQMVNQKLDEALMDKKDK